MADKQIETGHREDERGPFRPPKYWRSQRLTHPLVGTAQLHQVKHPSEVLDWP